MATNVIQWNCKVDGGEALTVGAPFTLNCSGEAVQIDREKLSLRRPQESPYLLHILKIEDFNQTSLKAIATSYMASEQPMNIVGYGLTDGNKTVEFAPFSLHVQSVVTQENNPQGKPYPSFGPVLLSYPLWIWLAIAVVVLFAVGIIFRFYRVARQKKAFLKELSDRSTALTPYHQFQKELRQLTRNLPVSNPDQWEPSISEKLIKSLDTSYRWFLAREFKVPAHKWSASLVHREIKRIDRKLFKQAQKPLEIADRELRRAEKNFSRISLIDFQQLLEIVRKAADVIKQNRGQENLR